MTVKDAPAECFEQYSRQVYVWAYRFLGRHHDALDVVQDVFLRWNTQCADAAPDRPYGWLRRVTINRALDLCKARRRQVEVDDVSGAGQETVASGRDPLDVDALREDIVAALDALSDAQRSVLVAKVYDGLTFARIASELDLAVSTVKTHYLRAIRATRGRLHGRWADL